MSQLFNKTARTFSFFGNPLISVPLILGLVLIETEGFLSGLKILSLILILIVFLFPPGSSSRPKVGPMQIQMFRTKAKEFIFI